MEIKTLYKFRKVKKCEFDEIMTYYLFDSTYFWYRVERKDKSYPFKIYWSIYKVNSENYNNECKQSECVKNYLLSSEQGYKLEREYQLYLRNLKLNNIWEK